MSKAKKTLSRADLKEFVTKATLDQLDFVITMIQNKLRGEPLLPPKAAKKAKAPPPKPYKPKRDSTHLRVIQGNKK